MFPSLQSSLINSKQGQHWLYKIKSTMPALDLPLYLPGRKQSP